MQQTGPETVLAFGFFRSIVCVHQLTSFVADMDGKSPWWVVDLPTPQNPGTHLLRERLLLWQTPLIRQDTFVLGRTNLVIAVDNKPVLKIFGDRSLDQISNPRLRNLKEKTLLYYFRMVHVPGARNKASDAISVGDMQF